MKETEKMAIPIEKKQSDYYLSNKRESMTKLNLGIHTHEIEGILYL